MPMTANDFATLPGVQTTPAADIAGSVQRQVDQAIAQLSPGTKGALLFVATQTNGKVGINQVLVAKVHEHLEVVEWFGKNFHEPVEGGVAVKVSW